MSTKIRRIMCLIACLAVTPAVTADAQDGTAQSEDTARRDEIRQRRKQRRQRVLRRVLDAVTEPADGARQPDQDARDAAERSGIIDQLLPLLPRGGAEQEQDTEPLEPGRLNDALRDEIIGPLVKDLTSIESLRLQIDEETTDLDRNRIGLAADVRLRRAPWGTPAHVQLHVFARIEQRPQRGTRAFITVDFDARTDTIACMNYVKQRALEGMYSDPPEDLSAEELDELHQLLESTPPFVTLTDVADFLPKMGVIHVRSANRLVDQLQAELALGGDPRSRPRLQRDLSRAYQKRDALLAASIQFSRDSALSVQQVNYVLPPGSMSNGAFQVEDADVLLTQQSIRGNSTVSVGPAGVLIFQGARGLVIEPMLRRIQRRDPATLDSVRRQARDVGQQLEELSSPPPEAEVLPPPAQQ